MGFLNKLNEITKPKIVTAQFDFGDGEGEQPVHFRALTYTQRQEIFVKRLDKDGKLDIAGSALHMNAELLAATLVEENGKPIATKDAILLWDSGLVDRLSALASDAVGITKKADENPSSPQN